MSETEYDRSGIKREREWEEFAPAFEPDRIQKDIVEGDLIQSLIRAHLYIENILIKGIESRVVHPEILQAERIDFRWLVRFAIAVRALPPNMKAPLFFINSLRNKVAHHLDYRIEQDKLHELRNTIDKDYRSVIDDVFEKHFGNAEETMQKFIGGIVMTCDYWRHISEQEQKDLEHSQKRLRAAIDRSKT